MPDNRKIPRARASIHLDPLSAAQLSELAMHYDRTMDQAAIIAIHIAYLGHLDEKRDAALRALNLALRGAAPDTDLPF